MSDFTKCADEACPMKEKCYRYTAKASERQSYFATPMWDKEKEDCDYYWHTPQTTLKKRRAKCS